MTYYAHELFRAPAAAPAWFDRALTVAGLFSLGYDRAPAEWDAVFCDSHACQAALAHLASDDDNDRRRAMTLRVQALRAAARAPVKDFNL